MLFTPIFRKHYLIFVCVMIGFILSAIAMNQLIFRIVLGSASPPPSPPVFFAKVIDQLNHTDRLSALKQIEAMNERQTPFRFTLLDQNAHLIYPAHAQLPTSLSTMRLPTVAYEFVSLPDSESAHEPGPGGPMPPHFEGVILFKGPPAQYLLVQMNPMETPHPPAYLWVGTMGLLALSVLGGIGFALGLLHRTIRDQVEQADLVISELQRGNLKARFEIKKQGDFSEPMIRFNRMADEIEHLVQRLQSTERSRMTLLQELAHDLRTPIASLKNLLETITHHGNAISPTTQKEIFSLSLKEVTYFERLVEDLLILAQVSEPRFQIKTSNINLIELIEEVSSGTPSHEITISISTELKQADFVGDLLLLQRLMKNALDNALDFAKNTIEIRVSRIGTSLVVTIKDDGPGFTAAAIEHFGVRRVTRVLGSKGKDSTRLSVGLGSVIMKTILEAHRGQLAARNVVDEHGNILGGEITFYFPG